MSEVESSDDEYQVLIPGWKVFMFQLFTVLSYANSAVNPLLYVFVNEYFRQNCLAAISLRLGNGDAPSAPPQRPVAMATPCGGVGPSNQSDGGKSLQVILVGQNSATQGGGAVVLTTRASVNGLEYNKHVVDASR